MYSAVQKGVMWYVGLCKCKAVSAGPDYLAAQRSCNSISVPDYVQSTQICCQRCQEHSCATHTESDMTEFVLHETSVKLWLVCKICRYMLEHTSKHVPLVDPTGRLPVAPSDATVSVPKSFGLGNSTPRALALQEASFPNAGVSGSLLPRKLRYQS